MKKTKFYALLGGVGILAASIFLIAADHIDSPSVANSTSDIADLYAFEGDNPNNTVFVATMQGPLSPGSVTENAIFDEDVLVEFNIDNTGDFKEDLVIQAIRRDSVMYFFGPSVVSEAQQGLNSEIYIDDFAGQVEVSEEGETITSSNNGMTFFAGPRRDPFYFDFNQFNEVVSGNAAPAGFLPEGQASDFFANLNVLAIVVEVPNSLLGDAPSHVAGAVGINGLPNAYNVWVTTKRKQ
ncbi:MAG: molecular chaperone DnaK [Alteromonas sp.]|nr:molecular chaperone DnaK [Alteromonas sp.]MAY23622.1 molecular chaperone DnaK [Flavobacteriaceae bacterium]|tara:strand:- start:11594 stop:12310 length:717 start_codon:yes stop_codon:yes gene_type:complete